MLHILLVILKILGIILACLLGLLLLLVLIVLLVPVRYRVDAKKREEVIIKMRANWLMRIVFLRVWIIDKQLHIKLRILGLTFWDNLRPKKEKKAKKTKKVRVKKIKGKKTKPARPKEPIDKELDQKSEKTSAVSLKKDEPQLIVKKSESANNTESVDEDETIEIEQKSLQDLHKILEQYKQHAYTESTEDKKETSSRMAGKIKSFFAKIKGFFEKIPKLGKIIKSKIIKLIDFVNKLLNKRSLISIFLHDEVNRGGIKLAIAQLLEVLRHCGPQKVEGYVKFGTGDPESTGKLLGVGAIFYARYGKNVTIVPDFEEKVFEAEGMVKGRIRIIRLLIIGIKIIRDNNFKTLQKNVRKLKEEL